MGGICLGRVKARMCLFLFFSCFVKLMNENRASEYSLPTPDSHSHHQQYTPFVLSSSQDMHHHLPSLHHAHPHSHHAHSHSLPKGLDTQAVNLMGLPPYDALPPQNQAQQVKLPPPSHVSPPAGAHAGGHGGQGGQQAPQQQGQQPVGDKQALLANEKRRRRRESHNAVERRRRDNINEKISELATLIPECMLDVGGKLLFCFSVVCFLCCLGGGGGWWLMGLFAFGALFVSNTGLEVFSPFLFSCVGSPSWVQSIAFLVFLLHPKT